LIGQLDHVRQLEAQNQALQTEVAAARERLRQAAVTQEELRR
jgi:uncharacterized protein involved in exopolysaccharide biosynthesis